MEVVVESKKPSYGMVMSLCLYFSTDLLNHPCYIDLLASPQGAIPLGPPIQTRVITVKPTG